VFALKSSTSVAIKLSIAVKKVASMMLRAGGRSAASEAASVRVPSQRQREPKAGNRTHSCLGVRRGQAQFQSELWTAA